MWRLLWFLETQTSKIQSTHTYPCYDVAVGWGNYQEVAAKLCPPGTHTHTRARQAFCGSPEAYISKSPLWLTQHIPAVGTGLYTDPTYPCSGGDLYIGSCIIENKSDSHIQCTWKEQITKVKKTVLFKLSFLRKIKKGLATNHQNYFLQLLR